jgi:hypothetical protein
MGLFKEGVIHENSALKKMISIMCENIIADILKSGKKM